MPAFTPFTCFFSVLGTGCRNGARDGCFSIRLHN